MGQAGLVACLREKRLAIPVPLGRDLGQQQAAAASHFRNQAVAADFEVLGPCDGLELSEQRQLDLEVRKLYQGNRRKPRIGAAGRHRASRDDNAQGQVRFDVADAPSQIAALADGDEHAGRAREKSFGSLLPGLGPQAAACDMSGDRFSREAQQQAAISGVCHRRE